MAVHRVVVEPQDGPPDELLEVPYEDLRNRRALANWLAARADWCARTGNVLPGIRSRTRFAMASHGLSEPPYITRGGRP
jgi:hypothetical protein